jgi:hypothetical protein
MKRLLPSVILLTVGLAAAKEDPRIEAQQLFDRAKAVTIGNDVPYAMTANVRLASEEGIGPQAGSISIRQASQNRLRIEIALPAYREIKIRRGDRMFGFNSRGPLADRSGQLFGILERPSRLELGADYRVSKVSSERIAGHAARCVHAASPASTPTGIQYLGKYRACFDVQTGTMVFEETEYGFGRGKSSTEYLEFGQFEGKFFPRKFHHLRNREVIVDVSEAVLEPYADTAADFDPPVTAEEYPSCEGKSVPARPLRTPDSLPPPTSSGRRESLRVGVLVGVDGFPKRITSYKPDSPYSKTAVENIRHWTFTPATCDGKPAEYYLPLELNFGKY